MGRRGSRIACGFGLFVALGGLGALAAAAPPGGTESQSAAGAAPAVLDGDGVPPDAFADSSSKPPWPFKKHSVGKGFWSCLAIDPAGNPHVVFGHQSKTAERLEHSWFDGHHWLKETVDADVGDLVGVAAAFDAAGVLHVAYGTVATFLADPILRYARLDGGTWTTEDVEQGGLGVSMTVDETDAVHVVHASGSYSSPGPIRHLVHTAGDWDADTVAVDGYFDRTSVQARAGKVYATYALTTDSFVLHVATLDSGTWTPEVVDSGYRGSLAIDSSGMLHVTYATAPNGELRHAWLDPEDGWLHETLVSTFNVLGETDTAGLSMSGDDSALAAGPDGQLYLAFALTANRDFASVNQLFTGMYSDGAWQLTGSGPIFSGSGNSIARAPNGLLHIATGKVHGSGPGTILELRLKGRKLSLSVKPKEAGTVTVAPTGVECTKKSSVEFYPGTEVTLTEAPAPGFTFVGWFKDCTGTDPTCNVTLDKNRKVIANFVASP